MHSCQASARVCIGGVCVCVCGGMRGVGNKYPGRLTSKDRAKGKDTGVLVMVSKNTSFRQNNLVCERQGGAEHVNILSFIESRRTT